MSRFGRLEFDDQESRQNLVRLDPVTQRRQEQTVPDGYDRDERYWLRLAGDERRKGSFEPALRNYSRALELDKSLVAGWVGQVQMLIALGEYPEAALWSGKALELFKNNADLLAARAQALCRTGDMKAAQASCDAAIGQQGLFSYPWVARGEIMLARKENLDDYCFDKAAQIDSDWLVALEVGAVYLHYDRAAKALTWARRAAEKAPDQAYCWYRQGECEAALGLTAAAERSFGRCLQLVPKHADATRALGDLSSGGSVGRLFRRLFRKS